MWTFKMGRIPKCITVNAKRKCVSPQLIVLQLYSVLLACSLLQLMHVCSDNAASVQ